MNFFAFFDLNLSSGRFGSISYIWKSDTKSINEVVKFKLFIAIYHEILFCIVIHKRHLVGVIEKNKSFFYVIEDEFIKLVYHTFFRVVINRVVDH